MQILHKHQDPLARITLNTNA